MDTTVQSALDENKQKADSPPQKGLDASTNRFLEEVKSFEADRVALAKQSTKTAWKVAAGAGVIAVLAIVAVVVMVPLKEVQPYLLKVDNATGHTTMVKPLADAEGVSYGEVLDKYWVSTFIGSRAGYEWETIQNSYNTVKLMSSEKVFATYANYILSDNSPTEIFGSNKTIKIETRGITFLPSTSQEQTLVQVQFSRDVQNKKGETATGYDKTYWNSTLTFDYQGTITTEDERLLNPLGFRVTSYREDRILQ